MTYKLSKTSKQKLATCHKDLQLIVDTVINIIDFTVLEGVRSLENQQKYFNENKSQLDGINKLSKHQVTKNRNCSLAVDLAPYPINWNDKLSFYYLAGIVKGVSHMLLTEKRISHKIRWGGDWNSNNNLKDQTFFDLPHFELITL